MNRTDFRSRLNYDPIPFLLGGDDLALNYRVRKELLGERTLRKEASWLMPEIRKLVRTQRPDGSWRYKGNRPGEENNENYELLETFRKLGIMIECYGMDRSHHAVVHACRFILSNQTEEGDIRGIYGNQYSPNYTAAMLELMVKAGLHHTPGVERGYHWLLSVRQDDGGWAVPLRTHQGMSFRQAACSDPLPPIVSKPSSYWCTGVVLRAFACHPRFGRSREAIEAAMLLKQGVFKPDRYSDRRAPSFWTKFTYPFWFNDLNATLDVLSRLGISGEDDDVRRIVNYFRSRQIEDGSFDLSFLAGGGRDLSRWVPFRFCRSLLRLYGAVEA